MESHKGPRALLVLICVCFVFAGCRNPEDPRVWTDVRDTDAGFAAKFPRPFKGHEIRVETKDSAEGPVQFKVYGQSGLAFYYAITCATFPPTATDQIEPHEALNKAADELLAEYQADVLVRETISQKSVPGLLIRANIPREPNDMLNNNQLHCMIFVRTNQIFRVTAIGLGNEFMVERFFEAFKFLERPTPLIPVTQYDTER